MSSDWNGNSGGGALAVWSAPDSERPPPLGSHTFTTGDHVTATAFAGPRVYVSSNTSSNWWWSSTPLSPATLSRFLGLVAVLV
jgi:hypothetical protein